MTDFTEEQEPEVQKIRQFEQWRIVADTDYYDMIEVIAMKVQQGLRDPFALEVARQLHAGFKQQAFPQPPQKKPEPVADDSKEE